VFESFLLIFVSKTVENGLEGIVLLRMFRHLLFRLPLVVTSLKTARRQQR
jgi:hypothetical protein